MKVRIKNCGLTTPETVTHACATGAGFVGFVHHPASPRHLSLAAGARLQPYTSPAVKRVAVLVAPDDALLTDILAAWRPDYLQVHNVREPERLHLIRARVPLILALPIQNAADISASAAYADCCDMLLLDAPSPGSGASFDWHLLTKTPPARDSWFLAGGLTPDNVAEALRITSAPMVDVSSGIESSPGIKSLEKITAFNRAATRTNARPETD